MNEKQEDDDYEEEPRRFDVDILIHHPTMTPDEISEGVGLEAHYSRCVGAPYVRLDGTVVEGKKYPETFVRNCCRFEVKNQHFADEIVKFVDSLEPHKAFLTHLRATGGTAQVIVQFLGDGYFGDTVPIDTLVFRSKQMIPIERV